MKWMALAEPKKGKHHTLGNTMPYYRFTGIFGTGGVKSAGLRKQRRKQLLVDPDYKEHEALEHVDTPMSLKALLSSR
jgi:hypothetical protein